MIWKAQAQMKRGKDEEKVMGPLFPRLHVNDTEKGGPRAPPRNKMALYEQLSIPSQRFKPGLVPINSSSTANVIPTSSSQGSAQQRGMLFPHQLPPSRQAAGKAGSCNFDSSAPLMPLEQNKKSEEDDFRVPIFILSSGPHSSKHVTKSDDVQRQMANSGSTVRQEARSYHNEDNLKDFVPSQEQSIKAVSNSSPMKNNEVSLTQNSTSFCHEPLDNAVNNCSRLQMSDHEHRAACDPKSRTNGDAILDEPSRCKNNGNFSSAVWDYNSEEQRTLDDTESHEDRAFRLTRAEITEKGDDASETSMVDSVSEMDITPDDVVGIIGTKHFWKARRAIVNQQRVFAVQVFELHRLIKVQKLIATSPHLLLEDNSFLAKPIKVSSAKKLPLEYGVKGPTNTARVKNDAEKQNHKMECSAENTVGKASLSSVQNGCQLPSHRPFIQSSPVTSLSGDPNLASWCFPQPQGHHQWLIPVMSPSEGLVYKPYPGPGYMAQACGGCGPPVAMPMMGNFYNPAYGVPASHHYQGAGVPPFTTTPSGPQGHFPPYGMPILNQGAITGSAVDQVNHFASSGFHGKLTGVGTNVQHQNLSNLASPKHGGANGAATPDLSKARASRESEMQASTASSPSERIRGIGRGGSVLSLFPTSPVVDTSDNGTQPQDTTRLPPRVIKVVPHNGRSATESAARIFQSIQEERKQYD